MKKERFVDWWKQDKRYMTLLKAVLMALLPLLCCLVRTAAEGRSIGQVYLPSLGNATNYSISSKVRDGNR